ncbi:MAG: hypothetical protein II563_11175, partial [Treponema sp.]|nr:hypothetical protein [Treponema sp.]
HNNNINNHIQKSSSKENISKVREDNYSGKRDYFSSKKKNEITSVEKMQNIKLIKYKNNNNDNHVLALHNEKIEENSENLISQTSRFLNLIQASSRLFP